MLSAAFDLTGGLKMWSNGQGVRAGLATTAVRRNKLGQANRAFQQLMSEPDRHCRLDLKPSSPENPCVVANPCGFREANCSGLESATFRDAR
jgi:hypothetical protein